MYTYSYAYIYVYTSVYLCTMKVLQTNRIGYIDRSAPHHVSSCMMVIATQTAHMLNMYSPYCSTRTVRVLYSSVLQSSTYCIFFLKKTKHITMILLFMNRLV